MKFSKLSALTIILMVLLLPVSTAEIDLGDWAKGSADPAEWGKDWIEDQAKDAVFGSEVSEGMDQIFKKVSDQFDTYARRKNPPCKWAAISQANNALYEMKNQRLLGGMGRVVWGIEKKLITLGSSALGGWIKSQAQDKIRGAIKDWLGGQPDEVYEDDWSSGACKVAVKSVWQKKAGKFKIILAGDCECEKVPVAPFTGRKIRLDEWMVVISGTVNVKLSKDGKSFSYRPWIRKIYVDANCQCDLPKTSVTDDSSDSDDSPILRERAVDGLANAFYGVWSFFSKEDQKAKALERKAKKLREEVKARAAAEAAKPKVVAGEGEPLVIDDPVPEPEPEPEPEPTKKIDCTPCDSIYAEIQQTEKAIQDAWKEKNDAERSRGSYDIAIRNAKNRLDQAKKDLERFDNPGDYVESDGRRVDSTDLRTREKAVDEAWDKWRAGELTSEQIEEYWESLTPEEIERLRKEAREEMTSKIESLESEIETLEAEREEARARIEKAKKKIEELNKKLEALKKKYAECLKKCKEGEDVSSYTQTGAVCGNQLFEEGEQCEWSIGKHSNCEGEKICNKETCQCDEPKAAEKKEIYCNNMADEDGDGLTDCNDPDCSGNKHCEGYVPATLGDDLLELIPDDYGTQDKTCEEVCEEEGRSTEMPDYISDVLDYLNENARCKASASVGYPKALKIVDCMCYSLEDATVTVSADDLICKGTVCGDVKCDESTTCKGGDAWAACNWEGWFATDQGEVYASTG